MHPFYRWHTDDESNTEDWLTPLVADVARACGCSACVCVCCSAGLRPPIGCRAVAFAALPALPANDSRLSLPLPPPLALVQRAPVSPGPSRPADRQTDRLQPHTQAALNKEKREERRECARSLAAPPLGRKLLLLLLRRKWRPFQACSQRRRLVCVCVSLRLAGLARSAPTAAPIIFGQPASQQTKSGQIVQRTNDAARSLCPKTCSSDTSTRIYRQPSNLQRSHVFTLLETASLRPVCKHLYRETLEFCVIARRYFNLI